LCVILKKNCAIGKFGSYTVVIKNTYGTLGECIECYNAKKKEVNFHERLFFESTSGNGSFDQQEVWQAKER
jgi:hypothetical protein